MIDRIRFSWQLLVLACILVLLGMVVLSRCQVNLSLLEYLISLLSVVAINFITFLIMSGGIRKGNKEGVVNLLAGIGVKLLLYLLFILLSWVLTKNLTKAFIITFFALYLIFTFFTGAHLFKMLKNK